MEIVFASTTSVVAFNGGSIKIAKGSHWPKNDPLVKANPSLFSDDPRYGLIYTVEPAGYHDEPGQPLARNARVTNRGN